MMLKAVIDELARRFVASNVGASGRHRLREKTEDLVLDLLASLETASLAEIAEATRALERRRKARGSGRAVVNGAGGARKGSRMTESRASTAEASPPREAASAAELNPARSPFDITMPSDLLDQHSSTPPARGSGRTGHDVATGVADLTAVASARTEGPLKPGVSLREGEQLLRTGGSGAIIRRMRGS
jgi:hypothetical protein